MFKKLFKLPSIQNLIQESITTAKRFPLPIACAIIATISALYLVEASPSSEIEPTVIKVMLTLIFAVPLFTSGQLFSERNNLSSSTKIYLNLGLAVLLIINFISLPADLSVAEERFLYRFFLTGACYFLSITFAAFLTKNENRGFWEFNKTIITKFFLTVLYTGVLFAGIAIALATIDHLLQVSINEDRYLEIWIIIALAIAPWLFLNSFPKKFASLNKETTYHKSIRIFGQYILTPLVVTYFAILYIYSAKLVITNEWPINEVTYLTIFFALAGILTHLILYPIRQDKEHQWATWFQKSFYIALTPLLGIVFYAISLRINSYGITENRYFVVAIALWLLALSIYKIFFDKKENIKLILISFTAILLLTNYGPWSAYTISENSQVERLKNLLIQYERLVETDNTFKAQTDDSLVPDHDAQSIHSILRYLNQNHGYHKISNWFEEDLETYNKEYGRYASSTRIAEELLNVKYVEYRRGSDTYFSFNWPESNFHTIDISGYDQLMSVSYFGTYTEKPELKIENGTKLLITPKGTETTISFDLQDTINSLKKKQEFSYPNISQEDLTLEQETNNIKVKLIIRSIGARLNNDTASLDTLNAHILIKNN